MLKITHFKVWPKRYFKDTVFGTVSTNENLPNILLLDAKYNMEPLPSVDILLSMS